MREKNLDFDDDDFLVRVMILLGPLGAVIGLLAGVPDEQRKGREESDASDVGPGFRKRQELCIAVEYAGHGLVAPLANEVRFANSLVRKGSLKSDNRSG